MQTAQHVTSPQTLNQVNVKAQLKKNTKRKKELSCLHAAELSVRTINYTLLSNIYSLEAKCCLSCSWKSDTHCV